MSLVQKKARNMWALLDGQGMETMVFHFFKGYAFHQAKERKCNNTMYVYIYITTISRGKSQKRVKGKCSNKGYNTHTDNQKSGQG